MDNTPYSDIVQKLRRRLWIERGLFALVLTGVLGAWLHPVLFPSVWAVYADDRPIVAMAEQADIRAALERFKREQAGETAGVEFVNAVKIARAAPSKVEITDAETAVECLEAAVKLRADRAVLYVDELPVVALPDEDAAAKVLERLKTDLAPRGGSVKDAQFKQQVTVRVEPAEQDMWADVDTAVALLKGEEGDEGRTHTITAGETASAIAAKYDVTVADLKRANAGADLNQIHPGEALQIGNAAAEPLLTLAAEAETTQTVTTSYPITVHRSPKMYRGKRIVKHPGRPGRERLVYRVRYENGQPVGRELLRRELLARPQARIVVLGAKPRPRGA